MKQTNKQLIEHNKTQKVNKNILVFIFKMHNLGVNMHISGIYFILHILKTRKHISWYFMTTIVHYADKQGSGLIARMIIKIRAEKSA